MSNIKIHVLHTGAVCVAPDLPFGGDHCNAIKASGIFQPRKNRLWLPVSAYLIEHPKGMFLVDTGWARAMSPNGEFDKKAQIKSLGSVVLYEVNQGQIPLGECVDEQLAAMGMRTSDIDAVLITHLDCDHANGIVQVKDVKRFAPFDFFRSRCAAYNTTFRVPSSSEQSGCVNAPVPVTHVSAIRVCQRPVPVTHVSTPPSAAFGTASHEPCVECGVAVSSRCAAFRTAFLVLHGTWWIRIGSTTIAHESHPADPRVMFAPVGRDHVRGKRGHVMKAKFIHRCTHVLDKEATIAFYEEALGFHVVRESGPEDGSWTNTFMVNDETPFELELTWNRGRTEPYENGGKDVHIAFRVDDYDAYHALHERMGCIVKENPRMGLYFIADPDGQWIEILPTR